MPSSEERLKSIRVRILECPTREIEGVKWVVATMALKATGAASNTTDAWKKRGKYERQNAEFKAQKMRIDSHDYVTVDWAVKICSDVLGDKLPQSPSPSRASPPLHAAPASPKRARRRIEFCAVAECEGAAVADKLCSYHATIYADAEKTWEVLNLIESQIRITVFVRKPKRPKRQRSSAKQKQWLPCVLLCLSNGQR